MLFSGIHHQRKDAIGGIVNVLLTSISIKPVDAIFASDLLAFNAYLKPEMATALQILKQFVHDYVIRVPQVQIAEYKGQQIIMDIFEALSADPEKATSDFGSTRLASRPESYRGVSCDHRSHIIHD